MGSVTAFPGAVRALDRNEQARNFAFRDALQRVLQRHTTKPRSAFGWKLSTFLNTPHCSGLKPLLFQMKERRNERVAAD